MPGPFPSTDTKGPDLESGFRATRMDCVATIEGELTGLLTGCPVPPAIVIYLVVYYIYCIISYQFYSLAYCVDFDCVISSPTTLVHSAHLQLNLVRNLILSKARLLPLHQTIAAGAFTIFSTNGFRAKQFDAGHGLKVMRCNGHSMQNICTPHFPQNWLQVTDV